MGCGLLKNRRFGSVRPSVFATVFVPDEERGGIHLGQQFGTVPPPSYSGFSLEVIRMARLFQAYGRRKRLKPRTSKHGRRKTSVRRCKPSGVWPSPHLQTEQKRDKREHCSTRNFYRARWQALPVALRLVNRKCALAQPVPANPNFKS